ncbi:PfkB family carbohydrate kinase [Nocardia sp. NPDC050412]|uniref:PfkB family carbohydrate kinase n=1 Tax=Nocardia sp. NPDC050412 TaxID=3364320 RepID=UPI003793D050
MTTALQLLSELPAPIQAVVFGAEIPRMDTDAGRRVSAAWQRASEELEQIRQRLDAEIALLPEAVRDSLGGQIHDAVQPLPTAVAGSGEFCKSMAHYTDRSTADTDKQGYTMYAFGAMTVYQLLLAGGWHPLRALQVLSEARAEHLARFAAFVAERAGAGAAAVAERAGLLLMQAGGFAALTAGVDAGVQLGQILGILNGHRDSVDWDSVATAGVAGAGAGLGGALGGHLAQAVVPHAAPALLGRAVVAATAGISGVIGGAAAAAAMTGQFQLTLAALASGAAVGMASAHAQARAHPDMAAPTPPAAENVGAGLHADEVVRSDAPAKKPVSAVGISENSVVAETPVHGAGGEDSAASATNSGAGGEPDAALYRRLNELREQELAEARTASGDAAVSGSQHGAEWPEESGSSNGMAHPSGDPTAPGVDAAELARRVAVRDEARAELAASLGVSPQEVRLWGRRVLEEAIGKCDALLGALGDEGWALLDPAVRARALDDVVPGTVDWARKLTEDYGNTASVQQWLADSGMTGQRADAADGSELPAVRRAAETEGAAPVVQLLDQLDRYVAAETHVSSADGRAADGTWDPAHPQYAVARSEQGSGVDRSAHQSAEAAPIAGESAGVVAEPSGEAGAQRVPIDTDGAAPDAATAGADGAPSLEQSIREYGARAGADAVAGARASDFKALQRESARADTELAKWLGLSDTEFHSMSPSRLRSAIECWVERAEQSPHVAEQAREHAGGLIGDEVRRTLAADQSSGRFLAGAGELREGQAVSGDLRDRLRQWVGADAATVDRWTDAHQAFDRLLKSPQLVLRLGAEEGTADPEIALDRARALRERELAETTGGEQSGLTPAAADALAAAGLRPAVSPEPVAVGGSDSGTSSTPSPGSTTPDGLKSNAAQSYSSPPSQSAQPSGSSNRVPSEAVRERDGASVPQTPPDPVRAAALERFRQLREQDLADNETTLTPEARDALAAAGLWSSESVPAGGPEESSVSARSTTPGGSESDGTGPYSAPERPHAGVSESSDRGSASVAVVERDAVVESVPVDPVREAALERFRQLREQDLAETEQTRRADTTESLSDPAQALDTGSAAAGSAHTGAGAPEESAARAAVPPPGDNGGHPGAAAGNRPVESSPETPSLTTASEARMSSVVPGAAMLGLAAAASNDTDAADAIGAQGVPDVRSTVAPGSTAASQEPVDAPSGGTPEGDGPDLRRQHAEATADAAELFGVAPQELKLWGRRLVEQVIDRFEARLAELADRGWGRLDAAVRSGLLADLGEMFGRELRDQAAIRREAASVLDWLCVAGLEPDGTASSTGHRLSVLRRLAEEFPSSPVDRLVEALDRFMTTDAQLEAMPPIPEGTDRRSTSDAHHTEAAPVVAPAVSRPRQTFGESWWFSSPLRPEWIRLGLRRGELARELAREHGVEIDHWGLGPDSPELARLNAELATARAELARLLGVEPDELNTPRIEQVLEDASLASSGERPSAGTGVESGDGEYLIDIARLCLLLAALRETAVGFNRVSAEATAVAASRGDSGQKWLSRLVQMGPGELRRHWQMLQAIPRGRARVPGISSGHALERPPRIAFEPEFPEFPMRPSGSDRATHSTQVPLHSLPVGLWRRPDTARAVATRQDSDRPLLPIAGADALPEGNGDSRPPDPPRAPTPINCAPLVVGYLIEENGSAAIARNLAAAPLTPDPRLGGTSLEQLHSVLGSKRWEPVATWEELADRLRGMQPGAAAFVVTESDHARAVSGQGHARLLFHAKDQPGTIKWRDPLVDDGARQLFEAGKLPSDLHIFALVYEADAELRPSLGEPRPHVTLRSQHAPRLAVAGADASDAIGDPSPSGDVVAGAGNVIGAPSHTRPADISKLEREMVEGNLLSTILYENQLDEIRTLAGDIVPQRVLHQARRAAVAREKKLSAELERLAVVYRADLSELRPGSAYLKQRLEAFEAKARELADQLVHLRDREVGVEDPDHARLLEILRQLDLGPRDGPQRVLRVIEHFQQALRVVDRPYWQRFTRDVAGGGLSNLPEWLIRGILDVDSPLNLSGILWVPDLGFAQRAERIEISDPAAEWRILGEAVGPSSDIGRLIETMIEYLELGRLVENVRELREEKRLIARLRSIQDKLGAVRASTIESPGVGEEIEVMSRRLESLVRLRDVRDKWLELCGADPSDPNFSIARLRREFEELTASLSADLRAAGVLPPEGELTVGVVRRAETEREIQQRQAPIGTGAGGKLSEIPRFGSRAARHRRLSQLLGYIAECDPLEEVLDSEFERLRKVGKYLAAQLGLDQRQGSHTSAGWLQVGDPRAFEPTGAVDASLRGWGEWIAEAADVRRGVFEAVVRRARQLGVQNADQRAPQELARTVEALIDWALDFRDAVPHPPGIEADRAEAAHTATFGGIVQDYLALFDYALIRERSARAEAATAVARDVLAQNVVDARGGRSLAPQVAVVESGDGAPEVFVAGSVATLGRALDAVAPEVLADLSERGARFHYCEVTVDENGRAYLRDVRPAPVTAPDAAAAQTESEVLAAAPPDPEPVRDGNNDASREAEWDAARAAVERQLDSWRLEGQKGERLTDYVAFLPSESGGRLVVAAPGGMHRRALLDVVTTDSRFVAARWHPRFDRHYLRVSSGPDGPVVTPISAATAEGEYREATVAEVEGILLDEYLRFRRLGLVDTTFGDWIGGLGTQVCYRKKDIRQAAAAGIEATAGHLKRDGTVLVFAYAAAEAQSSVDMDLPHPAAVLVRIATRQIALPVRTDEASDGPWRVVIRGDVDLGVLNPVVEICVDGLAWRVAPPRGRGDAGDILNRWFQGMSATTPDLLLERLAEAVSAGRPPSTARSATPVRRERGKQHRFSDSWQLSATNGRAEIIVDLGRGPDGWLAWPAPDTEAGLLEPLDDLNLRSLVRRVADSLRETSVKSVDRTRRKLEVTLVPEENRRYEDLVREADAAAERFRLWTEACAALASRLGLPEHDGQALGPLREQVSADRAALADELRIDPLELASIPLPDTRLAARRQEILRRESDIREYIDLLEQRGGLTDTLSSTQRRRDDFLTSRVIAAELRGRSDGQSLNNRIGHLPDVAGGVLVVAAPPGRHMASLVELAAERPKFADALWRDELEKRYLAVTLGPDGRIEVRTVPDAEAEGPRRRQSEDEILAQLLDRYLTYREAGVTTRGLREWLVGLDSSIFGAKSQVASSPVSPMSTAEVYGPLRDTDYLLWLGYHKVIAQPAIERSDPAYVLYRLRTRQIPPLAETRPDPSVHRDPVLWATNLGNTTALLLPLEQHEGRWRLSLGSGSVICDVLSRHFPDLTAGTPAELVERLEASLRDDNPRRVVPWHHRSSVPKTCLLVAADAAGQGTGMRPRFDIPHDRRVQIPLAGVDGKDVSRWARANWHPNGFSDAAQIVAHVRESEGTVVGAVDFGAAGGHAFTVKMDDAVIVVVEQVAYLDDDNMIVTEVRTVRGDKAVDAWAAHLTMTAGEGATFHGVAFKSDGTPELPLSPDEEPVGRRGREIPIRRLGDRPPGRAPPEDDSFEPHAIAEPAQSHMAVAGTGAEDLGPSAPGAADPNVRLAVARRADERRKQLRRELSELLAPHGIDPDELLRTGSLVWADWSARYRDARGALVDMLGIERGRAVDDGWIHHMLAVRDENSSAAPELASARAAFAETTPVARLVDDIQYQTRWARTIQAVEAELARRADEVARLIAQAYALLRAFANFGPRAALLPAIGSVLAAADRRLAARQRLEGQARDLFALGTAIEDYERESFEPIQQQIFRAARRYRSSSWDSRQGMLLLHARLQHLLATAQDEERERSAELHWLEQRAAATVEHYDTIELLNTDLGVALEYMDRALAGVPAASVAPAWRLPELTDDAPFSECLAAVRDNIAHQRRLAFVALLDGLSSEFGLDIPALDERGAGVYDLSRLTSVPPGESERLDTTIGLIHELGRARRRLTRIDTITAAMDEADHRAKLGRERLARLMSDHLRKYPLDRRMSRGELEPDLSEMRAAADACAVGLPGDGWAQAPLEEVRRRVAVLRQGSESAGTTYLADRYLALRQLTDAFDEQTPWSNWYYNLYLHQLRLVALVRRKRKDHLNRAEAENRLGQLAEKAGVDLNRWDSLPEAREALRRMVKRDLRWLSLVLGSDTAPTLRSPDRSRTHTRHLASAPTTLEDMFMRRADLHPRSAVVRERVERWISRTTMVDVVDEIDDLTTSIDRFAPDLDQWLDATMITAGEVGGLEVAPDDGTAEYVPPDSHSVSQCVPLTAALHRARTGNENVNVPDDVGLAGVSFDSYVQFLHGLPQWFPVDPDHPHRSVVKALLDTVASLPVDQRAGVSTIVVDVAHAVNEHGVGAHTYRVEYRCDEHGNHGWLEVQDPGRGLRRAWDDTTKSADLAGIWAMGFDRMGNALRLPGADIGEPPIDLQIGQGTRTTPIPDPHDRDYQKLGDWLAAVRRHYGVTQQQLADRIHRGSRTVWRAERRGTISADYLRAFGRAFGISDEVLHIAVSRLEPRLAHYFSGALPDPASNIYRTMGGWLKAIREHYGLTQMEVANRMNLHMETVSRAEKDFRVTGNYLQVFGRALSISDEVLHAAARQLEPHVAHYFSGALPDPASNVYRTIGGWLEAVREYYGLTQLQVAERVNRAHKTVWNAENGAVTADYLQAFGNAFDIPNDVLYRATSLLEPGLAHYFSSNIPQPATSLHQNIGDWLTAVRQQRGLSQQEVATLMRRHIKTISAVENSDSATLDFLRTWRDALDVPDQAIRAAVQQFLAPASPVDRPEDEDFWRLIATKPGSMEETSIRNRIYQEYDWVAKAAAQRWPMIFESREDLTQRYAIAILRAIVNHIPAGPPFVAHAWAASRGAMRSTYFEWRFPGLEASERTRAVKVYTYRNKRYAETGEMPDIREIADALDLTSDQVTAARQIIETTTGSLDDTRHGEIRARQVADPNPQGAYTGGTDSDSDLDGFDDDSPFVGKVRAALADLPDPEAAIRLVELHFVHGVPLDEAAGRLDIDHIAATEILARAVDNLRAEFTEAPDAGSITEPDAGPETGPRVNRPSGAITEEVDRDADAADQPPTGEAFSEPPQHSDVGRDHAADGVLPEFEDASGRTAYDPAATTVEPETSDSEATSNTAAPTPMLSAHAEPDDLAVARAADADSVVGLSDEVLSAAAARDLGHLFDDGAPAPGPLGSPRVVTAGNVVIDVIVDFDELPGVEEYRDARSIRDTPGGKALNQGIAAARLGAIVDVVSVTGADGSGTEIRETLRREGIRFDGMRIEDDIATGKVACFVGPDGETSFIYHISRELDLTSDDIRRSIGAIENADIVLLTFTAPDATVAQIAAVARENGAMVVLQPAPPRDQVSFDTVRMADVLVPNETEARALLAAASSDAASADAESLRADLLPERLFELLGVPTIVVTLGAAGCAVHHQGRTELFEAHSASVVDTTGASDAFTAALAMGVVAGLPVSRAVQIGLSAAAHAVAHSGGHESMPHAHDLDLSLMGASSEEGVPTNPTSGSASEAVARPADPSEPTSEPADSWPEQGRSDAEQRDDARPADGGAPSRETAIADGFRRWHETRVRNQEAGFGTQSLGQYARMHNVDGRQIRRWLAEIGAEPDNAPDAPVPHPHTFDLSRDWASHVRRYLALTPDDMDVLTDAAPGSWQGIEDGARRPPADQVRALLRRVPDARHLYAPLAQVFCSDLAAGPPADVGSSLRRLREYSGLTREQLAHELGVIPMTIDNREAADHLVPKGWEAHVRALAARLSDGIDGDADIGVCLRVLRLRTGLPRRSLAAKMDMAEDIIADIEAGRSQPSKDIVEACLCSMIPGTPIFPEGYPHAGRYLRYRREQAGISLSQVATATGMTVAMVRQREAGAVPLSTEMVEAYLGDDDFDLSIRRNIIEVFPSLDPAHDQNFGRRNVPDYSSEVLLFPDPRNTRNLVDYKDQFQRVNGLTDIGVRRMFGLYQGRPPAGGVDAALRVYDRFLWQAGHWNDFAAAWGHRYRMDPLGESAPDPGDFQSILDWQEATRLYHRTTAAVFREGRPDFRGASAAEKQAGLAQLHRMGEAGYISAEMTRRAAEQFHITDPAARPTPWSSRGSAPSTEPGTRSATPWSARAETSTRSAEDHPDDPAPQA